jgi:hypothetical protein
MELFGEAIRSNFRKFEDYKPFWQRINNMIKACKKRKDVNNG